MGGGGTFPQALSFCLLEKPFAQCFFSASPPLLLKGLPLGSGPQPLSPHVPGGRAGPWVSRRALLMTGAFLCTEP